MEDTWFQTDNTFWPLSPQAPPVELFDALPAQQIDAPMMTPLADRPLVDRPTNTFTAQTSRFAIVSQEEIEAQRKVDERVVHFGRNSFTN